MSSGTRRKFLKQVTGVGVACSANLFAPHLESGRSPQSAQAAAPSETLSRIYIDSRRTIGALWSGKIPANRARLSAHSMLRAGPVADGGLAPGQAIKIAHCLVRLRGKGRKCFLGCVAGARQRKDRRRGRRAYRRARRRGLCRSASKGI